MQTQSHVLVAFALTKSLRRKITIPRWPFVLGAFIPDVPLTLLWIGTVLYDRYVLGVGAQPMMDELYDQLYFTNPLWISSYNLFHSPTLLLILLALLWPFRQRIGAKLRWCFWFVTGCLAHTALDIPTHADDGPLLFYPFDWSYRFHSPISYWDRRHYAAQFRVFELALDLILLAYLLLPPLWRWLRRRRSSMLSGPVS